MAGVTETNKAPDKADIQQQGQSSGPYGNEPHVKARVPDAKPIHNPPGR